MPNWLNSACLARNLEVTCARLIVTAGLAYGCSKKDLPGHSFFIFFVFFTMLFGGGMVPYYLVVKGLGLTNKVWSMILPMMINAWYMFIMMRFFDSLPRDLEDAARIDGASELIDQETGRSLVVQPEQARAGYAARVGTWLDSFASAVTGEGMDYLRVTTGDVLERELRRFLVSRRRAA